MRADGSRATRRASMALTHAGLLGTTAGTGQARATIRAVFRALPMPETAFSEALNDGTSKNRSERLECKAHGTERRDIPCG